ncbi:hypothetical protein D918_01088 [Trichuris suis]|nr:hypothetical protein D918_01088 [Trichuris suis]
MIVNCPETEDEHMDADDVKGYFQLKCDNKCKKHRRRWYPGQLLDVHSFGLFEQYDGCFRSCVNSTVTKLRQTVPVKTMKGKPSPKEKQMRSCSRLCSKGFEAVGDDGSDSESSQQSSEEDCTARCKNAVELIANGTTWTMFFPAKVPKVSQPFKCMAKCCNIRPLKIRYGIDKRTLKKIKTERAVLRQHADHFSEVYCTEDSLTARLDEKNVTRRDLRQMREKCKNATTKLWEREPYFCLLFLDVQEHSQLLS